MYPQNLMQHLPSFKSCPREGASYNPFVYIRSDDVSSRAPVRGHPKRILRKTVLVSFKSCPREGASTGYTYIYKEDKFQVVPP